MMPSYSIGDDSPKSIHDPIVTNIMKPVIHHTKLSISPTPEHLLIHNIVAARSINNLMMTDHARIGAASILHTSPFPHLIRLTETKSTLYHMKNSITSVMKI